MFSIRSKCRSDDGLDRNHPTVHLTLLAVVPDDSLESGRYYADLGFRPPAARTVPVHL